MDHKQEQNRRKKESDSKKLKYESENKDSEGGGSGAIGAQDGGLVSKKSDHQLSDSDWGSSFEEPGQGSQDKERKDEVDIVPGNVQNVASSVDQDSENTGS